MLKHLLVTVVLLKAVLIYTANLEVLESDENLSLENGYTKVSFNKRLGCVDSVVSDFSGTGSFSDNILSDKFGLETKKSTGHCFSNKQSPQVSWNYSVEGCVSLKIGNIFDCVSEPLISETWKISLCNNQRSVEIDIDGEVLRDDNVISVTHSLYLKTVSIYGLFDRGVAQMMNKEGGCLGSTEKMNRTYFIGNNHALDFIPRASTQSSQVVLLSQFKSFSSGIQNVLYGAYPSNSLNFSSAWNTRCWNGASNTAVRAGEKYSVSYSLIPNNHDFPVFLLNRVQETKTTLPVLDLQTYLTGIYASPVGCLQSYYYNQAGTIAPTIAHPDIGYSPDTNFFDPDNFLSLSAMLYSNDPYLIAQVKQVIERTAETMCGIGSDTDKSYCGLSRQRLNHELLAVKHFDAVHMLQYKEKVASATAIKRSKHAQSKVTSDEQSAAAAVAQLHATLDNSRSGQLMHHFISLSPTYESIAGSEQLGPNVFWTMTVLKYISVTQDATFALEMHDFITLSTKFLLTFLDEKKNLINAPGPLWIDVIVRENYTSDSSAIMVPLLHLLSDYYTYVEGVVDAGQNKGKDGNDIPVLYPVDSTFPAYLVKLADDITTAINTHLWDETANDHYLTQLNLDGTVRDFVDYDSNLLTVAYGIAPKDRQQALIARVDSGAYTHVRGTWCSEKPYSGDREDCYIVGGTVCGDSVVTLARIGWVDATARKRIGDLRTFEDLLLTPLQHDLVASTWLFERYDSNATQIRTSFYFEYPSLVAIMLREVRYGINLNLNSVDISPFPATPFHYNLGNVQVTYGSDAVSLILPGDRSLVRSKRVNIANMRPRSSYIVLNSCDANFSVTVDTNEANELVFDAVFADACEITANLL